MLFRSASAATATEKANIAVTNAETSTTQAQTATTKAAEAASSAAAAKTSETNAKSSETNAKTSETSAKTAETSAAASDASAQHWAEEAKDAAERASAAADARAFYDVNVYPDGETKGDILSFTQLNGELKEVTLGQAETSRETVFSISDPTPANIILSLPRQMLRISIFRAPATSFPSTRILSARTRQVSPIFESTTRP